MRLRISSILKVVQLGLLIGLTVLTGAASASIYIFEDQNPIGSNNVGVFESIYSEFNVDNETLWWMTSFSETESGVMPNGFWLALSDGKNPKETTNKIAILYGDTIDGMLSAYVYDPDHGAKSWKTPGEFIRTFENVVEKVEENGKTTIKFHISTAEINDYLPSGSDGSIWDGIKVGDHIGIWYHPVLLEDIKHDLEGKLVYFDFHKHGWYDRRYLPTQAVPEPGSLALLALGLGGLGIMKRREKKAKNSRIKDGATI